MNKRLLTNFFLKQGFAFLDFPFFYCSLNKAVLVFFLYKEFKMIKEVWVCGVCNDDDRYGGVEIFYSNVSEDYICQACWDIMIENKIKEKVRRLKNEAS